MNRNLRTTIFVAISMALFEPVGAQTEKNDFSKVRNAYLNTRELSFDVEVYTYSSEADKTPELLSKGYMKKSNDKYYSNFNNFELLINGDKAIVVDRETKSIEYYEYTKMNSEMAMGDQLNIDSMMQETDSIIVRAPVNGLKHITCFSENGYIRQTELYIDPVSNFIKRILYYYVESNEDFEIEMDRVEIIYNNIQTTAIDEKYFNFEKYFKKTNAVITLVEEYRGYQMNYHNEDL